MAKISDELRRQANCIRSLNSKTHTYKDPCKIERLADCIDAEMVELPRDADSVPIHVGDTVWGCISGMQMAVHELRLTADGWSISTSRGYLTDAEVTHTRPDSWERIADELEAWCDSVDVDGDACGEPRELAARIRTLAKKEDRQCQ